MPQTTHEPDTAIDHGSIDGLGDDDHTSYHTDARAVTWHDADDHSGLSHAKMATGTYTGDGNATKGITGVGFQPKYVRIFCHGASYIGVRCEKTDQDGVYSMGGDVNLVQYLADGIISLDADGFTVGDGTGWAANWWNLNNNVYTYIAWTF